MRSLITLAVCLSVSVFVCAQSPISKKELTGMVVDDKNECLQGTVITVFDKDSVVLAHAVSDSVGVFSVTYPQKDIRLAASLLGYEKRYLSVKENNNKSIKIMLKPTAHIIGDVVVSGRNMVRKGTKLIIYPSELIKKNAYDGFSALNLLDAPDLEVDMLEQTITRNGAAATLCINGREVKSDEVSTLNPDDIKRIDYCQQSTPEHPMAKFVIDFIVKNHNHGGQLYAKANHNLNVAKGGAMVNAKQYFEKSEFDVQLSGNYSRYTPNEGTISSTYMPFEDETVTKNVNTLPSSQRDNETSARISYFYKYNKGERFNLFNASALLKKGHNISGRYLTEAFNDNVMTSTDYRHRDNLSPALQLYYETSTKKSKLKFKFNGNHNHAQSNREYASLMPVSSNTDQKYTALLSDLSYTRSIGKRHTAFAMFRHYYNNIKTEYAEGEKLTMSNLSDNYFILFAGDEMEVVPQKFFLSLTGIIGVQSINNGIGKQTSTKFNPSLDYFINITDKNSVNGTIARGSSDPDFTYYSEAEQSIDKYQRLKGNPGLEINDFYYMSLNYSHNNKWGGFDLKTDYMYQKLPIYKVLECDNARHVYVQSYMNTSAIGNFTTYATLRLNLLKNRLKWKGGISYTSQENGLNEDETCNFFGFNTSLTYLANKFSVKAEFSTGSKSIDMGEIYRKPINLRFTMAYTYNKWHFTLDVKNPFYKTWAEKEYRYGGYVRTSRQYSPYSWYNVFSIGANYRISYGRKHKFQNVDMDETVKSAILEE